MAQWDMKNFFFRCPLFQVIDQMREVSRGHSEETAILRRERDEMVKVREFSSARAVTCACGCTTRASSDYKDQKRPEHSVALTSLSTSVPPVAASSPR